jgi:hypothetical protein
MLLLVCASLGSGPVAQAQSVTPMRGVAKSFTDVFAIRLTVGNPYQKPVQFDVRVYDENFDPVDAFVSPQVLRIGARDTRQVTVRIPFLGKGQRKVRVCAEGLFGTDNKSSVRTQVCGRFLGQLVGS